MKLAFWNVGYNDDAACLLAAHATPDVMALAECAAPATVEASLRSLDQNWNWVRTGSRVCIFARTPRCEPRLGSAHEWSIVTLRPNETASHTLVAVHLRSRMYATASDINIDCFRLRQDILAAEGDAGHRRTVLIGDFNLDPYDIGLSDHRMLLGAMDRRLAHRLDARPATREGAFYNPMWSRMGDDSPGPPGTYYRSGDDHHDYFFHTFDQVLVRPTLIDRLHAVTVLRRLGDVELVSKMDLPRRPVASDHLPLIVELSRGANDG